MVEPTVRGESRRNGLQSWRPGANLQPIERYGRFDVLGRIGRGGMAEILLARERGPLGAIRHLVIKRILPEIADNREMLRMFLDEARLVMGLSHPNLCQIYDIGEEAGSWYIAMEWVNGTTLHELVRRASTSGCLDETMMASIISQCAEALDHAHHARDSEGNPVHLVHRDVSPHNIMVAFDGRVKLLDFGIAKSAVSTHRTEVGIVKGKVCYLAPEQWQTAPLDARTDVFALGCCLFEALSGRVLFRRDAQVDVMRAVLVERIPTLLEEVKGVPPRLSEITARALELAPEDRFQSAAEMSDALEAYLASAQGAVRPGRLAGYVRALFSAEVELGPVLERAVRGAHIAEEGSARSPMPSATPSGMRGFSIPAPPPPSQRPHSHSQLPREGSLPPPVPRDALEKALRSSRPPENADGALAQRTEAQAVTVDVHVDAAGMAAEIAALVQAQREMRADNDVDAPGFELDPVSMWLSPAEPEEDFRKLPAGATSSDSSEGADGFGTFTAPICLSAASPEGGARPAVSSMEAASSLTQPLSLTALVSLVEPPARTEPISLTESIVAAPLLFPLRRTESASPRPQSQPAPVKASPSVSAVVPVPADRTIASTAPAHSLPRPIIMPQLPDEAIPYVPPVPARTWQAVAITLLTVVGIIMTYWAFLPARPPTGKRATPPSAEASPQPLIGPQISGDLQLVGPSPGSLEGATTTAEPQAEPHRNAVRSSGQRARGPARMSIDTRPPSKVYIGKRLLGTTPIASVTVPTTAFMLRFVDRDGKLHLRYQALSREPVRNLFYDFSTSPK
jgi:serine/threonine protein kinase